MQTFRETLYIAVEKTIKMHDQSDSDQPVLSTAGCDVRQIKSEVLHIKNRLRSLKRESCLAETIEDQQHIQTEIRDVEKLQRRQRQQIFAVEDELIKKRDELIEVLEQKLQQKAHVDDLFVIRWNVA